MEDSPGSRKTEHVPNKWGHALSSPHPESPRILGLQTRAWKLETGWGQFVFQHCSVVQSELDGDMTFDLCI